MVKEQVFSGSFHFVCNRCGAAIDGYEVHHHVCGRESEERYFVRESNGYGQKTTTIFSRTNTEPVCQVFTHWHPGIAEEILDILNRNHPMEVDACACGQEKPVGFLHCGCGRKGDTKGEKQD